MSKYSKPVPFVVPVDPVRDLILADPRALRVGVAEILMNPVDWRRFGSPTVIELVPGYRVPVSAVPLSEASRRPAAGRVRWCYRTRENLDPIEPVRAAPPAPGGMGRLISAIVELKPAASADGPHIYIGDSFGRVRWPAGTPTPFNGVGGLGQAIAQDRRAIVRGVSHVTIDRTLHAELGSVDRILVPGLAGPVPLIVRDHAGALPSASVSSSVIWYHCRRRAVQSPAP